MNLSYIDNSRSTGLCDVGMPGYVAAVAITANGETDLVLVNRLLVGDSSPTYNPSTPQAPHEQVGELQTRWRSRVLLAPLRCGRRAKSGAPCRIPVTRPGDMRGKRALDHVLGALRTVPAGAQHALPN